MSGEGESECEGEGEGDGEGEGKCEGEGQRGQGQPAARKREEKSRLATQAVESNLEFGVRQVFRFPGRRLQHYRNHARGIRQVL